MPIPTPIVNGLLVVLLLMSPLRHEEAPLIREVRFQADNDSFNLWMPLHKRSDHEYTHGSRLTLVTGSAWGWGTRLAGDRPVCGEEWLGSACLLTVWELGQEIYTPRVNSAAPVEGERPHAGWLYGAVTGVAQTPSARHAVRLELGLTGPQSLAGPVQVAVHRLGGYWTPVGWDNQLPFEPGVVVSYTGNHLLAAPTLHGVRVAEISATVGAAAGNVITGATTGLDVRAGFNVPRSWYDHDEWSHDPLGVYGILSLQADALLRNLFLDGNSFRESQRVDKLPFVGRRQVGFGVRFHTVELSVRQVTRGREYRTEPGGHSYTRVDVAIRR
jgi:lipid A 3-O-deacylase